MQSALGPSTPTGATAFRKIKCQARGGDAVPAIHVRQLGDCVLCAAWRHRQSALGHTGMSLRARHLITLCNWLLPGDAAQVAACMAMRRPGDPSDEPHRSGSSGLREDGERRAGGQHGAERGGNGASAGACWRVWPPFPSPASQPGLAPDVYRDSAGLEQCFGLNPAARLRGCGFPGCAVGGYCGGAGSLSPGRVMPCS